MALIKESFQSACSARFRMQETPWPILAYHHTAGGQVVESLLDRLITGADRAYLCDRFSSIRHYDCLPGSYAPYDFGEPRLGFVCRVCDHGQSLV